MDKLAYLLKLTQTELKIFLYNYLKTKNMSPISNDGFLYAEGTIPILLVAHMDTVFEEIPKNLVYKKNTDKIFNTIGGLGGDDRCGVYAIIQLLEKHRPYILFTEDEEIGCIGASKAIEKLTKPNVKYIIEFDRRGKNDCVFYDCGNKKFINYIESFGFTTNYGTYSDISIIGKSWNIASVNLSSGYYNEHTEKEYIIFSQLQKTINRANLMIKELKKAPYFNYQEIVHTSSPFFFQFIKNIIDNDWLLWIDKTFSNKNNSNNSKVSEKLKISQDDISSKTDIKKLILSKSYKKNNKIGDK